MILIDQVSHRYGDLLALDEVTLEMGRGTITAIVGTSGSGKSTLLRTINRLIRPTAGRVLVDGRDVGDIPGEELRRGIGYVIQGYGLFPHWSVARNIGTVPSLLGWPKQRIRARVDELLEMFGLDPGLYRAKRPHELSGGEQQRVGVARALAAEPAILLMDEPFGSLDPIIRGKAQEDLLAIQRRLGLTIVLVTHDFDEAILLGDRIAVMSFGRVLQYATPAELLAHPAEGFVEQLVGARDRALRILSLTEAASAIEPGEAPGAAIAETTDLRSALSELLWRGAESLPVAGQDGAVRGRITLSAILSRAVGK